MSTNLNLIAFDIETEPIKNVCPECGEAGHFIPPSDPLSPTLFGMLMRCPECGTLHAKSDLEFDKGPARIVCVDFCWRHDDGITIEHRFFGDPGEYLSESTILNINKFIAGAHANGEIFTGVNIVGFDWKHLFFAGALPSNYVEIVHASFDPMFTAVCEFGYPVGLDALGFPLGIEKIKSYDGVEVSGAIAHSLWMAGNAEPVIAYIQQDTYQSLIVAEAILPARTMSWRNARGGVSTKQFVSRSVKAALHRPVPDTSWMDGGPLVTRDALTWWFVKKSEVAF